MAVTTTATLLGFFSSEAGTQVLSSADSSIDLWTIVHQLPTTPELVAITLRSIHSVASEGMPVLSLDSKNASQVVLRLVQTDSAVTNASFDVLCQHIFSKGW